MTEPAQAPYSGSFAMWQSKRGQAKGMRLTEEILNDMFPAHIATALKQGRKVVVVGGVVVVVVVLVLVGEGGGVMRLQQLQPKRLQLLPPIPLPIPEPSNPSLNPDTALDPNSQIEERGRGGTGGGGCCCCCCCCCYKYFYY